MATVSTHGIDPIIAGFIILHRLGCGFWRKVPLFTRFYAIARSDFDPYGFVIFLDSDLFGPNADAERGLGILMRFIRSTRFIFIRLSRCNEIPTRSTLVAEISERKFRRRYAYGLEIGSAFTTDCSRIDGNCAGGCATFDVLKNIG